MEIAPITLPNGRVIGPGHPCFVVAEVGQNHQGDVYTALRLLKAAHEARVDAVKFCKRDIGSDLSPEAYNRSYDNPHSFGETYGKHREALELSLADYRHLVERMRYNEWPEVFFSTVCDRVSADELEREIDPPMYKIASRDIDNRPLIEHVARFGKPVILSTGMQSGVIARQAVDVIRKHHDKVIVLYCVSEYPTPLEHLDLSVLPAMQEYFGCPVGFSDHTAGIVAAQAAALLGAVMVEKHVTLARAMKGTDHAGSLEPEGIRRLVRNIRAGEILQEPVEGAALAARRAAVEANRLKLGRSLVAARTILPGETIGEEMLALKSPGCGLGWGERGKVIGKTAEIYIGVGMLISEEDVETETADEVAEVPA